MHRWLSERDIKSCVRRADESGKVTGKHILTHSNER